MKRLIFIALSLAWCFSGCMYDRIKSTDSILTSLAISKVSIRNQIKGTNQMPKTNTHFCRPTEDGTSIIYAPVVLPPKMGAPTAEDYLAKNWYYNGITPPEPPEGKQLASTTYKVVYETTIAEYTYEDVPPPGIEEYDRLMEEHLTQERYERGYTTREPDSYLTSEVPRWAQDAKDWVLHRDKVMEYALQIMNEVAAGTREPPTLEEFSAGLPKIQWTFQMAE